MKLEWKTLAIFLAVLLLTNFATFMLSTTLTAPAAYKKGYQEGYVKSLNDIKEILGQKGITFSWQDMEDGRYILNVYLGGALWARGNITAHLWIQHYRDGKLLSSEYGAGVLTTLGKNWIETQLSGTLNASQHALYLSDSNNSTDPPLASWTVLPNEITSNGLDRQEGTYSSTGDGTWNVTVTKTVTGAQSTQLWGLNVDSTDNSEYLIAADSGPDQKNCVSGDTLKETWQMLVS